MGSTGVDSRPFFIDVFFLEGLAARRKETPRRQRRCRHLPRLGFPLWNPSSEASPQQGMAKGGNPSPLRRERQSCSRLRGPGGVAQTLRGLPFGSRPLQVFIFPSPSARAAAVAPVSRYGGPVGAKAVRRLWVSGPGKDSGLKAKGLMIFPPPTPFGCHPLSGFVECGKAACVRNTPADLSPHPPPGAPRK